MEYEAPAYQGMVTMNMIVELRNFELLNQATEHADVYDVLGAQRTVEQFVVQDPSAFAISFSSAVPL